MSQNVNGQQYCHKLSGEFIFKLPDFQKMWYVAAEQPGEIWD